MNVEDKNIHRILREYKDTLDIKKATRAIKNLFSGLCLYGEDIPLQCYNCGETIRPFSTDNVVQIHFDQGTHDTKVTQGEPASVFLECEKCTDAGNPTSITNNNWRGPDAKHMSRV